MFMNEYEIEIAARENRPGIAGQAAAYLHDFVRIVNSHSDGWAYWIAASKAAKNLCTFVDSKSTDATAFKIAVRPIKSLCTRRNLPRPLEQAS